MKKQGLTLAILIVLLVAQLPVFMFDFVPLVNAETPTTLQVSVAASADDAYAQMVNDTTLYTTGTSAQMRSYTDQYSTSYCVAGFRFILPIPKTALTTIISANLSLYVYSASYDDANMKVYGEAVDNSSNFSDNAHIGNVTYRPRTTNYVSWTANATGVGNITKTGFEPVIQEVVNRAGWVSGNALTLLAIPNTDQTLLFFVRTFDSAANTAACLFIEYSTMIETVYTNAFDSRKTEWTAVGSSPYLSDSDANYIYTATNAKDEGDWTFPTSAGSGTINSVKLRFEANVTVTDCGYVTVYVWNGASWVNVGIIDPTTMYAWYELDVSSTLNTWTKINGAEVYVVYTAEVAGTVFIRRLTRKIDFISDTTPPTFSNLNASTTVAGQSCLFSAKWTDDFDLASTGGFIFGTNNTGQWVNETWVAFTANPDWSNVTKNLNGTTGVRVEWKIWANDTANNWNSSMAIQYLITSDPLLEPLITNLIGLADRINWTESITTAYLGTLFGKTNMTDLQNIIATSTSWQDVLSWSAITIKYGIENETKIKWALNEATMVAGLPNATQELGYDSYMVHNRGALYGYYWADKYSYLQSKWNTTTAFNNFASAYNWTGHGFLWYVNASYTQSITYGPRYFDECAETLACFLIFYEMYNVSEALSYAETEWKYLNEHLWKTDPTYGDYFTYAASWQGWECSGGAFLQIIGWFKYLSPSVGNISRLITDMSNRYIRERWYSPQWTYSNTSAFPAIVIHMKDGNSERRLTSTITAWSSLFSMYLLFNDTEIQYFQDMLNGYTFGGTTYLPAWKCLYNTTAALYNQTAAAFGYSSTSATISNSATAFATALQFLMGMTPVNATLAVPVESLEYEHLFNMFDSQIFNISLTTRKITVGIGKAGAINFTYNATTTQMFNEAGLYELTFDTNWNTITNCTKVGSLPNRRYLELVTHLIAGWNNITAWNADVGKTIEQTCANIQYAGIGSTIIIKNNGTLYRYDYGYDPNATVLILVSSDEIQIYCLSSGFWYHDYSNFYFRKDSPSQSLNVAPANSKVAEFPRASSQTFNVGFVATRIVEFVRSVVQLIVTALSVLRLGELFRSASQTVALALQGIGAKTAIFLRDAILTITTSLQVSRLAEWFVAVSQSISMLFVGIRLAELAKTASLTIFLSLVGSRLIDVTRLSNQNVGFSVANSRLAEFVRTTSQTFSFGFATTGIAGFFRSVSQAITATLNAQRLIEVSRQVSQAIMFGLQAIGERVGIYLRNAALTVTLSLQGSRLAEWLKVATQSITFSFETSRVAGFVRSAAQAVSTVLNGPRMVELFRTASQTVALTLLGIGDKTGIYLRNAALTIATAVQGSRLAEWLKSASQTVSMMFGTARLAEFARVASQTVALAFSSVGEKLGNYVANVALTITTTLQNSRLADWTRQATQTLSLSLSTSRVAEFLALAVLTITTAFNASHLLEFLRQASQALSFVFNGERLIEVSRAVSQTIVLTLEGFGEFVGNYFRTALLNLNLDFIVESLVPEATVTLVLAIAIVVVACVVTYAVAKTQTTEKD